MMNIIKLAVIAVFLAALVIFDQPQAQVITKAKTDVENTAVMKN